MYGDHIKIRKIELRETEDMGKGFFAVQDIAKSQQLMIVTDETFISCSRYSEYYEFMDLKDGDTVSNKVLFSYFLATIKVIQTSEPQMADIYEYFKILPSKIDSLLNWSMQELERLENKQLIELTIKKREKIKKEYDIIRKTVEQIWKTPRSIYQYRIFQDESQIKKVKLEMVQYFYSVIQSRSVYHSCAQDVKSEVGAIVPFLQLFNHSTDPQCEVIGNQRYIVTTTRPIKKDEEVFVSYGKNNAEKFLQLYGFLQKPINPIRMHQNYRLRLADQYNKIYRLKSHQKQPPGSETQE